MIQLSKEGIYCFCLQIHCKTVRIFVYSSLREQSNQRFGTSLKMESETGKDAKNTGVGCVRLRARKSLTLCQF